ncbi:MAG: GNAT family N-acetyltransferase [Desulfobacterales bacterium]|nr:GNAT family N-acetyltransferase [Desulfobacterales bacterium]
MIIKPYHFDRNLEVISLLNRVFKPWMGDENYFIWKYKKIDDFSFPLAWIIEKDDKIIAFNGYRPRKIITYGKEFWSVQSFDTVTDPDYQGQGLFKLLQSSLYEKMRLSNIVWVYGWTSEIGYRAFTKKADWEIWGRQRYLMKVIKIKKLQFLPYLILSKFSRLSFPSISSKIKVKEKRIFPQSFNNICKNFETIALRDISYLNWRISNPDMLYKLFMAYINEEPKGYIIISEKDNCLNIHDLLSESPSVLFSLLSTIEHIAIKNKNDLILFRVNENHPYSKTFYRAGYFWSNTSFKMLGRKLFHNLPISTNNLHWTYFDRNE